MSTTYTYSQARQQLAAVLECARTEGEVRIQRRDGVEFAVRPVERTGSPLDVQGIDAGLSAAEIVDCVREVRERG
jgi:hypothetical protein